KGSELAHYWTTLAHISCLVAHSWPTFCPFWPTCIAERVLYSVFRPISSVRAKEFFATFTGIPPHAAFRKTFFIVLWPRPLNRTSLLEGQSPALLTSRARTGFNSTYRAAA